MNRSLLALPFLLLFGCSDSSTVASNNSLQTHSDPTARLPHATALGGIGPNGLHFQYVFWPQVALSTPKQPGGALFQITDIPNAPRDVANASYRLTDIGSALVLDIAWDEGSTERGQITFAEPGNPAAGYIYTITNHTDSEQVGFLTQMRLETVHGELGVVINNMITQGQLNDLEMVFKLAEGWF